MSPARRRLVLPVVLAALVSASLGVASTGAAWTDAIAVAAVSPRVFSPNGDRVDDLARLHVELRRSATVSVDVVDYAGSRVRSVLGARVVAAGPLDLSWNGRNSAGRAVLDGGYRFVVRVTDTVGSASAMVPVTKAVAPIYRAAPESIVIALDAGHGGPDPGAVRVGFAEKTATLDVVRRLRAMLEGAGVRVVATRNSDSRVNVRGVDWTADGKVGYPDELASRIELANQARAAVFLCVHANSSSSSRARGTETYLYPGRSFAGSSRLLAAQVQSRLVANLAPMRTSTWRPVDRGVRNYDFYVLTGYDPARRQRPSLMPGVLAETLFISNPGDRTVLRSATGRQRLAIGFYEALVRYFATRSWGAAYEPLGSPGTLQEGSAGTLNVRVRNTSPRPWGASAVSARLGWLPAVPWYDGTNAPGTELARLPLPALAPGASVDLAIPFTAPAAAGLARTGGRALLKLDLEAGATRFATAGVVPLQLPLLVTALPEPSPSPSPSPEPSVEPSPSPSPEPSVEPSVEPSPGASPSPSPEGPATTDPGATASPTPSPSVPPAIEPSPSPSPPPPG